MMKRFTMAVKAGILAMALGLPARAEFRVVGYLPAWNNDFSNIQYGKLSHILWSFAEPQDDGSLTGLEGAKLTRLVTAAHGQAKKVKVFLAIGGGGQGDKGWVAATATDAARRTLTAACMKAVRDYNLDGIDFDWEYPDGAQVAGYNAAVKMLAAALHAEGKEISAAVTMNDWPRSFPTNELFSHFDFLNIMVYDNPAPHSTVAHAQTGLDVWIKTKGLPREKAVLGCPFYGPTGRYNAIVAANPAAAWADQNGAEGYNSIPTMRKKTEIALDRAGGIMFWEISQDATGSLSLLSAVHEVIQKRPTRLTIAPVGPDPAAGAPYRMLWSGRGRMRFGGTPIAGSMVPRFDLTGKQRNEAGLRVP